MTNIFSEEQINEFFKRLSKADFDPLVINDYFQEKSNQLQFIDYVNNSLNTNPLKCGDLLKKFGQILFATRNSEEEVKRNISTVFCKLIPLTKGSFVILLESQKEEILTLTFDCLVQIQEYNSELFQLIFLNFNFDHDWFAKVFQSKLLFLPYIFCNYMVSFFKHLDEETLKKFVFRKKIVCSFLKEKFVENSLKITMLKLIKHGILFNDEFSKALKLKFFSLDLIQSILVNFLWASNSLVDDILKNVAHNFLVEMFTSKQRGLLMNNMTTQQTKSFYNGVHRVMSALDDVFSDSHQRSLALSLLSVHPSILKEFVEMRVEVVAVSDGPSVRQLLTFFVAMVAVEIKAARSPERVRLQVRKSVEGYPILELFKIISQKYLQEAYKSNDKTLVALCLRVNCLVFDFLDELDTLLHRHINIGVISSLKENILSLIINIKYVVIACRIHYLRLHQTRDYFILSNILQNIYGYKKRKFKEFNCAVMNIKLRNNNHVGLSSKRSEQGEGLFYNFFDVVCHPGLYIVSSWKEKTSLDNRIKILPNSLLYRKLDLKCKLQNVGYLKYKIGEILHVGLAGSEGGAVPSLDCVDDCLTLPYLFELVKRESEPGREVLRLLLIQQLTHPRFLAKILLKYFEDPSCLRFLNQLIEFEKTPSTRNSKGATTTTLLLAEIFLSSKLHKSARARLRQMINVGGDQTALVRQLLGYLAVLDDGDRSLKLQGTLASLLSDVIRSSDENQRLLRLALYDHRVLSWFTVFDSSDPKAKLVLDLIEIALSCPNRKQLLSGVKDRMLRDLDATDLVDGSPVNYELVGHLLDVASFEEIDTMLYMLMKSDSPSNDLLILRLNALKALEIQKSYLLPEPYLKDLEAAILEDIGEGASDNVVSALCTFCWDRLRSEVSDGLFQLSLSMPSPRLHPLLKGLMRTPKFSDKLLLWSVENKKLVKNNYLYFLPAFNDIVEKGADFVSVAFKLFFKSIMKWLRTPQPDTYVGSSLCHHHILSNISSSLDLKEKLLLVFEGFVDEGISDTIVIDSICFEDYYMCLLSVYKFLEGIGSSKAGKLCSQTLISFFDTLKGARYIALLEVAVRVVEGFQCLSNKHVQSVTVERMDEVLPFFLHILKKALVVDGNCEKKWELVSKFFSKFFTHSEIAELASINDFLRTSANFKSNFDSKAALSENARYFMFTFYYDLLRLDPKFCILSDVPLLLSMYKMTLSRLDRVILKCLFLYENKSCLKLKIYQPYAWGTIANNFYFKKRDASLKNQMKVSQFLNYLNSGRMLRLAVNFPLDLDLDVSGDDASVDPGVSTDIYDPRFLLPLICNLTRADVRLDSHVALLNSGVLPVLMSALASGCPGTRRIAYQSLFQIHGQFLTSNISSEKQIWLHFLETVRVTLSEQTTRNLRLSGPICNYLAKVSTVLCHPMDLMYRPLSYGFLAKARLDLLGIPEFSRLFFNSSPDDVEQCWILGVLNDGIRMEADANIFFKSHALKVLTSAFASNLYGSVIDECMLKVLARAFGLNANTLDNSNLVYIVNWLCLMSSKSSKFLRHKEKIVPLIKNILKSIIYDVLRNSDKAMTNPMLFVKFLLFSMSCMKHSQLKLR